MPWPNLACPVTMVECESGREEQSAGAGGAAVAHGSYHNVEEAKLAVRCAANVSCCLRSAPCYCARPVGSGIAEHIFWSVPPSNVRVLCWPLQVIVQAVAVALFAGTASCAPAHSPCLMLAPHFHAAARRCQQLPDDKAACCECCMSDYCTKVHMYEMSSGLV